MVHPMSFTTTDCWVLFSVGFGKKGSTLKNIISTGDVLNHAILTREELEASLNKLLHNDYISNKGNKFLATNTARKFYAENKKHFEGCIAELIRLSEILEQQPAKPGEINIIKITEEEYENAMNKPKQGFKPNN